MSLGAGKYDDLTTLVREKSEAQAVAVIVLNGNKGSGFSVQAFYPGLLTNLPDLLESMAKEIRADMTKHLPMGDEP